jgi:hypothetical protein
MRNEIVRVWQKGMKGPCELREGKLFPKTPKVGLVIGTFAAVPYIHLQLEARKRFYPKIPILIHDDASHRQKELARLCADYGADFESNAARQPPCVGDLTAIAGGLLWAKEKGIDLLVKASRRWIFRTDWATDLRRLAMASQYATFCSYTTTFDFGFRTECFGMSVNAWTNPPIFAELTEPIRDGRTVFVEGFVHNLARKLESFQSEEAEQWRIAHPMPRARSGYAQWGMMGTDRCASSANYLWHNCDSAAEYYRTAVDWGLPYAESDFADPNQGAGNGTKQAK